MNIDNLTNITKSLTGLSTLDKSDIDLTWNYFNNIVGCKETIMLLLTKAYSIPMIDYMEYTDNTNTKRVYEEYGLTLEEAENLQKYNLDILNMQKIVQLYCIQTFVAASYSTDILYTLIESLPQEKNVQNIQEFLNTISAFNKSEQSGGALPESILIMIVKLLVLAMLILPSVQGTDVAVTSALQLITDEKNQYKPYNTALINLDDETFEKDINNLKNSSPQKYNVDMTQALVVYDDNVNQSLKTLIGTFNSLFSTPEKAETVYQNIVNDFNSKTFNFSMEVTHECLELMKVMNKNGFFSNMEDINTIEENTNKMEEIKNIAKTSYTKNIEKAAAATVASGAFAILGSPSQSFAYASEALNALISTSNKETENKQLAEITKPTTQLIYTAQERAIIETNLRKYSNVYCEYGYNLYLKFNKTEKMFQMVGSKISYSWIEKALITYEKNIEFELKKMNNEENTIKYKLLNTTHQRLNILRDITVALRDTVQFGADSKLFGIVETASANTPSQIQMYFDSQIEKLRGLLNELKMYNPFYEREKKFEQGQKIEQLESQIQTETFKDLEQEFNNKIQTIVSEQHRKWLSSTFNATKSIAQSYVEMAKNVTALGFESTTDILTEVTTGLAKVATKPTIAAVNAMLWELIQSPGGWVVIGTSFMCLLILLQLSGFGLVRTFMSNGYRFVVFVFDNIVYVFKVIVTPFGWLFKKEQFLYMGSTTNVPAIENAPATENVVSGDAEVDETAELFSQLKLGGKRKTKRSKKLKHRKTKNVRKNNKNKKTNKKNRKNRYKYSRRR
jgi:hypothetical protein